MTSPTEANCQIIEAFGLNPHNVKSFRLDLDRVSGPIATVELYQINARGEKYVGDDGQVATVISTLAFYDPDATEEPRAYAAFWGDKVSD